MLDWGIGEYEITARELEPAAERVVAAVAIAPGERVLDVGCGTGNAALLAAANGASVTGVDPAERLVSVANERAGDLDATFLVAGAEELPFEDGAFDAIISVFAVIFAPDPDRAVAEMLRVLAAGGRLVMSSWAPEGTLHRAFGIIGQAVAEHSGAPPRERFEWGDPDALTALFERHGASVAIENAEISFVAASPEDWMEMGETRHPMGLAGRHVLAGAGVYDEVRARALAAVQEGNEDPDAFRTTSRYLVTTARRAG